jgi:hypothetical protein
MDFKDLLPLSILNLIFIFAPKFMMRYCFFLFLLCSQFSATAQFHKLQASFSHYTFNEINLEFLRENKIKSISYTYSTKEENQRIKDLGHTQKIVFNPQGFPEMKIEIRNADTIETRYYFTNANLTLAREFAKEGINSVYFSYDSMGNKTKEVYCKEINAGDSRTFFKVLRQEVSWSEKYQYEQLSKKQVRKLTLNDIDAVYKETIQYLDDKQQLIEENERFSMTGVAQNYKYIYNDSLNITEKIFFSEVVGELTEKYTFTYDSQGNLNEKIFFRNGIMQSQELYFYDKNKVMPQAVLTKYPNRKTIDMQSIVLEYF